MIVENIKIMYKAWFEAEMRDKGISEREPYERWLERKLYEAQSESQESDSLPCGTPWVAVEDSLPDDFVPVLIFESNAKWVSTGYWDGEVFEWEDDKQQFYDSKKASVSHWKPLPEPPCV